MHPITLGSRHERRKGNVRRGHRHGLQCGTLSTFNIIDHVFFRPMDEAAGAAMALVSGVAANPGRRDFVI
jgi:hypothetical protein